MTPTAPATAAPPGPVVTAGPLLTPLPGAVTLFAKLLIGICFLLILLILFILYGTFKIMLS
jgi:hypothetical protein